MSSQLLPNQASSADDARVDTAINAWVGLLRGHAVARRSLSAELQADHGLTINDYEALLLLSRAEGQRLRRVDLAGELQLSASGVTRLLDGLEQQSLVEKDTCSSDARVTYAVLTAGGREKLATAACSHVAAVQALFESYFSADELRILAELLGRLAGEDAHGASECGLDAAAQASPR
jgi:DNA-binding MarR family transcriptional regulator